MRAFEKISGGVLLAIVLSAPSSWAQQIEVELPKDSSVICDVNGEKQLDTLFAGIRKKLGAFSAQVGVESRWNPAEQRIDVNQYKVEVQGPLWFRAGADSLTKEELTTWQWEAGNSFLTVGRQHQDENAATRVALRRVRPSYRLEAGVKRWERQDQSWWNEAEVQLQLLW